MASDALASRRNDTIFPRLCPKHRHIHREFRHLVNGDAEEALKVFEAARGCGSFDLSNAHIDYEFMFDMANETFELPLEKKMKYEMSNTGRDSGYMMKGSNVLDFKCTPDENELCAVSDNEIMKIADESTKRPETINRRWSKSKEFMILAHGVVLVVLRVLSEKVGLGPDVLPDSHKFDWKGGHQARISHSLPVNADVIPFGEHTGE